VTTRTAAENRLSAASGALRLAVEVGIRLVKFKTIRSVLDHITETLVLSSGKFCDPLALDYAKCLRAVLNYQPAGTRAHRFVLCRMYQDR
jgi:ataxia telangiectasia mutated family protein